MFFDHTKNEGTIESSVRDIQLSAGKSKGCSMENCQCAANWKTYKKNPELAVKAHRVRKGKVENTMPKGSKEIVAHMKAEHKDITDPKGLAWYMHEKKGKK